MVKFHVFSLGLSLYLSLTGAATVFPQSAWLYPLAPDNATVMVIGQTYPLKWQPNLWTAWAEYMKAGDPRNSDLWITGFTEAYHSYQHLVASSVDVNATGYSVSWTVQIPSNELAQTPLWVFRFVPSGITPTATGNQQISSPQVFIAAVGAAVSSSTITRSTSTFSGLPSGIASTQSAIGSTATVTATPSPKASVATSKSTSSSSPSPSISGGTIAGIAVGAVIGCALLVGLGWYLARFRKLKPAFQSRSDTEPGTYDNRIYPEAVMVAPRKDNTTAYEAPVKHWNDGYTHGYNDYKVQPVSELESNQRSRLPAELSGTYVPRR